jgi:threonine/homoserine/homoserine lactone efflux protein
LEVDWSSRHNESTMLAALALLPLAVDRETAIIAALIALIVAALTVSVGAWVLLARERRQERAAQGQRPEPEGAADPFAEPLEPEA